jgi:hypothetical protein
MDLGRVIKEFDSPLEQPLHIPQAQPVEAPEKEAVPA